MHSVTKRGKPFPNSGTVLAELLEKPVVKFTVTIILIFALVYLVYSIYKTKKIFLAKQITLAFIAVILLAYILYTCKSDY